MARFNKILVARNSKATIDQVIVRKTIVSFFFFFVLCGAAIWGWRWLQKQPSDGAFGGGIKQPLRTVLNKNEKFFDHWLSPAHLAKTYPVSSAAKNVRVNGNLGLGDEFDPAKWELYVIKAKGDTLALTLDD